MVHVRINPWIALHHEAQFPVSDGFGLRHHECYIPGVFQKRAPACHNLLLKPPESHRLSETCGGGPFNAAPERCSAGSNLDVVQPIFYSLSKKAPDEDS
jgi:hypothetical protein